MEDLNIGAAMQAAMDGKRITRKGWNGKGLFVFMQNPTHIDEDIVPKMQSLPQSVKDEFARRFEGPDRHYIAYSNQMCLVDPSCLITGWSPSTPDVLARDWVILD